jgi:hypothetical protein
MIVGRSPRRNTETRPPATRVDNVLIIQKPQAVNFDLYFLLRPGTRLVCSANRDAHSGTRLAVSFCIIPRQTLLLSTAVLISAEGESCYLVTRDAETFWCFSFQQVHTVPVWTQDKTTLLCPDRLWGPPSQPPIQWVPGERGQDVKLTTHIPLVPSLRMRGAIPPLSHTSAWGGAYS